MKFLYRAIISFAILFTVVACIENAGIINSDNTSDNITDNLTELFLFDFGYVPIGKIKEVKLIYSGETTQVQIDKSYGDITMLNNHVAPSYSTNCGNATTDNSRVITLTKGCTLAYTISPAKAQDYNFTIPTDMGKISFKAKGIVAGTVASRVSADKLDYSMTSIVFGGQRIYFDNITLTQDGGGMINASYVFAKTNVDPAIARFIPDSDQFYTNALFPANANDYCTFSSDLKVRGMSGCKLLLIFDVTPRDLLENGKLPLQSGTYEAAFGFFSGTETIGNSSTITVKFL